MTQNVTRCDANVNAKPKYHCVLGFKGQVHPPPAPCAVRPPRRYDVRRRGWLSHGMAHGSGGAYYRTQGSSSLAPVRIIGASCVDRRETITYNAVRHVRSPQCGCCTVGWPTRRFISDFEIIQGYNTVTLSLRSLVIVVVPT